MTRSELLRISSRPALAFAFALALMTASWAVSRPDAAAPEIFETYDISPLPEDLFPRPEFSPDKKPAEDPAEVALAPPPVPEPEPWLEYRIRRNDTLARILDRIGADAEAKEFLLSQKMKSYRKLRRGDSVQFRLRDGRLAELQYKTSPEYYLRAGRDRGGKLWASENPPELTSREERRGGIIGDGEGLFVAADRAGVDDRVIQALIDLLETRVDFYRGVWAGDSFRVVYDRLADADGETAQTGRVKAFEFVNRGNAVRGAWSDSAGGYYDESGAAMRSAFLSAPLKYNRISSRFTNRRFHPVLKKWRAHRGVDYAAPTGTPVRSTAEGVVSFAGKKGGYGNLILVNHFKIYTTAYGHLHKFAKGIRKGRKVQQGQVIGYVGSTGLSTGPHLHYEFRVRGKHRDPLSQNIPKQLPPLKGDALAKFKAETEAVWARLSGVALL